MSRNRTHGVLAADEHTYLWRIRHRHDEGCMEHEGQENFSLDQIAIMHNLSSKVLDALTCGYTNVVKGDQVERCRTVRISADQCSPLQNFTQDQLQNLSNADI